MEELKRFEDKQKLANLQIEKRLVDLEKSLAEIKTELEKVTVLENMPENVTDIAKDFHSLKEDVEEIKKEKKEDVEQISALVDSVDISGLKKEFNELKKKVEDFTNRFEEEMKALRIIEDQMLKIQRSEDLHDILIKLKQAETKIDSVNLRLSSVEKKKLSEPIFIE